MPGNLIKINNSKDLQWYVGDSKMDKLIEVLDRLGSHYQAETGIKEKIKVY